MYVRGFSPYARLNDLRTHFDPKGDLVEDIIMREHFAFIFFRNSEDAAAAVRDLDRSRL